MAYTGLMRDTCKIGAYTEPPSGPSPAGSYAYGSEIACRFSWSSTREVGSGDNVVKTEAEIRVPKGTTVVHASRVELTKRSRTALSPSLFFEIAGEPRETQGQILLKCVLIDGTQAA